MGILRLLTFVACGLMFVTTVHGEDQRGAKLAQALEASDVPAAVEACVELTRLGPAGEPAVADLIKALQTSVSTELQRHAALTLGAIGPGAKAAVPALVATLQSRNAKVRAYAAHALGAIGPAARDAAIPLIELMTDKDPAVHRVVRDAVRLIDAPDDVVLPHVAKMLNTADPADAAAAIMTLAELGETAVPNLCAALDNDATCYWAALTLSEIGPKAAAAVPHLGKLLQHKDAEVRMQALIALGEIGAPSKAQIDDINRLLQNDDEDSVRYAAAYALGMIGDKSTARGPLNEAMDGDDAFLRVAGAWALLKLSQGETPLQRKAISRIIDGLASDDMNVRLAAARAMADPQFPSRLAAPVFDRTIADLEAENPEQVLPVLDALASLGPKVLPGCIRCLLQKRDTRFFAMQLLIRLGEDAAPAIPALIATLDDEDASVRREALFALGAIGEAASVATEEIVEKLNDAEIEVAHAACYALGGIGPKAQVALPTLAEKMSSQDDFLSIAAVWASLKIDPDNAQLQAKAVPYMTKALSDERELVRVEAAYVLGEIGAPAKAAIPALEKAREDSSPSVREAAEEALKVLQ